MTVRPARMLKDKFPVEYEPEAGGRIGLCARGASEATWFEVEPCVVLHTMNARESEDGSRVTLTALRSQPSGDASFIEAYASAYLHEVRPSACTYVRAHMHACAHACYLHEVRRSPCASLRQPTS